jgi:hypothetical protein
VSPMAAPIRSHEDVLSGESAIHHDDPPGVGGIDATAVAVGWSGSELASYGASSTRNSVHVGEFVRTFRLTATMPLSNATHIVLWSVATMLVLFAFTPELNLPISVNVLPLSLRVDDVDVNGVIRVNENWSTDRTNLNTISILTAAGQTGASG